MTSIHILYKKLSIKKIKVNFAQVNGTASFLMGSLSRFFFVTGDTLSKFTIDPYINYVFN